MNISNPDRKILLRVFFLNKYIGRLTILLALSVLFLTSCSKLAKNADVLTGLPTQVSTQETTIVPPSEPSLEASFTSTPEPTLSPALAFTSEPTLTPTLVPTETPTSAPVIFAAIGDYGSGSQAEADVASLVKSWNPEFIITLGDNNYPAGEAETIDQAIGQFYHSYIHPYVGSFGDGADVNRFFPSLGNHDVQTENGKPYFDYFTLPGNERYYDFVWGSLHLFALNALDSEPDGVGVSSVQAEWLKKALADSTSAWNIVYTHYPPYSSGLHGSTNWARWPYGEWGADIVLAGHDHSYERLEVGGLPYIVNGLGGGAVYYFVNILEGSQVRYTSDYGALRVEATEHSIKFEYINRQNEVIDTFEMQK